MNKGTKGDNTPTKSVDEYLNLPYTIEIVRDSTEDYSGWFARVIELPGCMTQADTIIELEQMINDAMRAWIETALEDGQEVPEPRADEDYSGKFIVRLPRYLHRQLSESAAHEGVSLNLFVSTALAKTIGQVNTVKVLDDQEVDALPVVHWPHLSDKAKRLMIAYNCKVEATEVNEHLFAEWIDNFLDQVRAAVEISDYKLAYRYTRSVRIALGKLADDSPLLRTYYQALELLEKQLSFSQQLLSGFLEQEQIKNRVLSETRSSSRQRIQLQELSSQNESEDSMFESRWDKMQMEDKNK